MGHTALAHAAMMGNEDMVSLLREVEHDPPLDDIEKLFADAARGKIAKEKLLDVQMTAEQGMMLCRIMPYDDRLPHAKALVALGIDPDWTDEMGMSAIHLAGWEGQPEILDYLLAVAPDPELKNGYGVDLLGAIVHGCENSPNRIRRDHIACARSALEAGAPLHRRDIDYCSVAKMSHFLNQWAAANPDGSI